ncbi:MAG TPA: DNA polymerase III subunit delta' [Caulobacteraceae bacterium]|jgi:DNA polymerase-3 subunit delta'|nr:DNA polymerase III subunit delta' [Caulobacteraceae bacterium]
MMDIPHPRDTCDWIGETAADAAVLSALERDRMHHAWLLQGPRGVGKATFAYRAARRLLGARPAAPLGLLGSDPEDPVSRQVAARAHPDLLVLQRDLEDGKARRNILVGDARDLPEFFSKSPASAPFRIAIVDAADDLNLNAANALLKILEEPPSRGVIFLVSHAPGGLLSTIRSRCRRLAIAPTGPEAARAWLADRAGVGPAEADSLLAMARGAPGGAWRLAEAGALEVDAAAARIVSALPQLEDRDVQSLADGFRPPLGQVRFRLFFDRLADRIHDRARDEAAGGRMDRARAWSAAWTDTLELARRTEAVNLDRNDVLFTALSRLRAIA